jgi:hypothetical protein
MMRAPIKPKSSTIIDLPLDMVGGTVYGRYPKISMEQTYNMIKSDGWMVPASGYRYLTSPGGSSKTPPSEEMFGRGIFNSVRLRKMVVVIDSGVYLATPSENPLVDTGLQKVGSLASSLGSVSIDENNNKQIAICDRSNLYVYDYGVGSFTKVKLSFTPNYVCFQDGYFIATDANFPQWHLSASNNAFSWPEGSANVGSFQTKPDLPVAVLRMPGKGNMLLIFGSTITEAWYDIGQNLFPYNKNIYFNVDFGCVNAATVAANNEMVVWVGINEKSGPRILVSDGGPPVQLSNDGINFRLAQLTNPYNSFGFFFEQDGHSIYQCSFPDDNLTFAYDFHEKLFYSFTDHYFNYHEARKVAFFNNSYFFVSDKNNGLYELNSKFYSYANQVIPRVRITKAIASPDRSRKVINNVTFPIEMGQFAGITDITPNVQAVDCAISKNGGQSFGSYARRNLNPLGNYQNRCNFWNLGMANEFVLQFRFSGLGRFVFTDGTVALYQ